MKREALDHTKMMKLSRLLGLERWGAVGIMESLWNLTARQSPAGNIGKLEDPDIAEGIGWKGEATQLVDALVEAKFLDHCDRHRLLVHDWHDHADDSVHMKLARARLFFANGKPPKLTKLPKAEKQDAVKYYASNKAAKKTPAVRTEKSRRAPALALAKPSHIQNLSPADAGERDALPGLPEIVLETAVSEIHQRHPAVRRCGPAEIRGKLLVILRKFPKEHRIEKIAKISTNHEAWCATEDWQKEGGQFAKGLANWLSPTIPRWDSSPDPEVPKTQAGLLDFAKMPGHMNPGLLTD
ncbi:MAG: hypothetical protein M3O20_09380 [Acidobacteriota bacterium]|nr:hypothetical protein [Acidobacteriota bacterium]